MELKPYQQQVIDDIALFLEQIQKRKNIKSAFYYFWAEHPRTALIPNEKSAIEPYKNNVPQVPHICVKVPTAGGKTFIACNAIKTIFDGLTYHKAKAVVWLVPSITILEQTIKNLKDPHHPYRQKINTHFGSKVEVLDKAALLQGSGFNASSVLEQLNIFVLSFDSIRTANKEGRKVFEENGALQSFENLIGGDGEISVMSVIQHLSPVLIVDESHNAESVLSVEMLKIFNPCFILDLTATPRKNSNIISYIDSLALKKEQMVKLPVIVYNHEDKTEVIHSSLQLQKSLEQQAIATEKKSGKYIRPIVLFQAQPKNGKDFLNADEEKSNVQKLKDKLLQLQIPAEQIKIKTANINELKGIDLMSKSCAVRFIITINALKEGWDCPFAYILASLADKNSSVDVEQILGRVLRQPYIMKHDAEMLNYAYVLTASAKFQDTLQHIVKGLNKAGFSGKDYRVLNDEMEAAEKLKAAQNILNLEFDTANNENIADDIDVDRILTEMEENNNVHSFTPPSVVQQITETAIQQNMSFELMLTEMDENNILPIPSELQKDINMYKLKSVFREEVEKISLPQFYLKIPSSSFFKMETGEAFLEKENLLGDFALSKSDTNISFSNIDSQLYRVDLDEAKEEHTPSYFKIDGEKKAKILQYLLAPSNNSTKIHRFSGLIMKIIGNMYPISDHEVKKYIERILSDFNDEQFQDFAQNEYAYTDKIKQKIKTLSEAHAEKTFRHFLDTDKVFIKSAYTFAKNISPSQTAKDIGKSLYEKEASMNGFEERVINDIANMPNVVFWTRNIERKGFKINGFINHYPDFIIQTKSGKTIILETKGDHLDAEQKIRLGKIWASKAGNDYRYFMVYERRTVDNAYNLEDFLTIMKDI